MKRVILISILLTGLSVSNGFAQMGHGMMRGGHMDDGHMSDSGRMMEQEQQGMPGPGQVMDRKMMGSMMGMIQDIAIMMRQMSEVMSNIPDMKSDLSRDKSYMMSGLMRDMAAEMNEISGIIGKGTATEEEMRVIHRRVMRLQEDMRKLIR